MTSAIHFIDGDGVAHAVKVIRRGVRRVWAVENEAHDFHWSALVIHDGFDVDGWLEHWIDELCSEDLGDVIADGFGQIVDGLGNVVGNLVLQVEGGVNDVGLLVADTGNSVYDAYCGVWGTSAPPEGLIGLINDLPIIGGFLEPFADLMAEWFGGDVEINKLIGQIPIVSDIAKQIGLIPDSLGNLADPINYVVDATGQVLGTLSCGVLDWSDGLPDELCFLIGIVGNSARMIIPDGLLSLDMVASRFRHELLTPDDDGWLEVEIADAGVPEFLTQIYRRYSNDGTGANGVGLDLRSGVASIVRRVGGVETLVAPDLTTFGSSDRLRLEQYDDVHTLLRNGTEVGAWNDVGATAARGAANRSVAMLMQGASEYRGTRLFSPSLSEIEAS